MSTAKVNGVELYYEITGEGFPLILNHEFAGTYRSWEPQVRFFSRRYQVITYNYRGFPPSEVPEEENAYSQEILVEDLYQLLRHLGIKQAFVGGLSMGGNIVLSFGIAHPEMTRALIVAAAGSGTTDGENFSAKMESVARQIEKEGWPTVAKSYASTPNRIRLLYKDPRGWREFCEELAAHSVKGSVLVIRNVILKRPPISILESELQQLQIPTLVMTGDEDEWCLDPALIMKRNIPDAGLLVFPRCGHAINQEEPAAFNRAVLDFLTAVEAGK
ncbi:alpha/beta fold hydrolase [Chloroflexota bacterium]